MALRFGAANRALVSFPNPNTFDASAHHGSAWSSVVRVVRNAWLNAWWDNADVAVEDGAEACCRVDTDAGVMNHAQRDYDNLVEGFAVW